MENNQIKPQNYAIKKANEIWKTLFLTTNPTIILSWGIEEPKIIYYKEMPALYMKVNGFFHKGYIVVAYDRSMDLYILHLLNDKNDCIKTVEDIFADDLGRIIDEQVERPTHLSQQEYNKLIENTIGL